MMKFSLFTLATLLLATAEAGQVTFNVISPGATTVQVKVNGKTTSLEAPYNNVPFYTGKVDVGSETSYRYIADDKAEEFTRQLTSGKEETYNEFFGRPVTYAQLPKLPRPLDNGKQWRRDDKNVDLFDSNYIPSIFVNGQSRDIPKMIRNVSKKKFPVDLTFIGKDWVKTFHNVTWGISGAGKSQNPAKQSWRWQLSPGDTFQARTQFKIRNMEEDPTQIREKLYADILHAMGTYANRANMVRYYINGEGYGTFNLLDDVKDYSYISAMFYNGHPPAEMGPLFDGSTGASFECLNDPYDYGSWKPAKGSPQGSDAIHQITTALQQLHVEDASAIQRFQRMFDVDQFLRFMVVEYLTADWDGYWQMQTNDGAYRDDAHNGTWYYIGQDFDGTFGVNLAVDVLNWSYKDYPKKFPRAVMINKLLENPDITHTFETYLKDTVQQLFNNHTLGPYITAYHDFIAPDLQWDRSIQQRSPGINYGWTFDQTYDNLFEEVVAPNKNGGGAAYGLTEWIDKKSKVAAKDLHFSL
ncbi:coth protein-domain-containing protein [Mycotypha africana]|uniref:coth protein-domain-containing protein n=1 Tax=Mycotypha africana TaxID=64632 RepID=UPI002301D3DE|nr:coth protein-domain-containing protein [Mycotypha africana]KAI8967146.1 coth protein-domain-containing protein [Mycotypha africana]